MAEPYRSATELERRVRAARELLGIRSDDELIAKLDARGMGKTSFRASMKGHRPVLGGDVAVLAAALEIDQGWFYVRDLRQVINAAVRAAHESADPLMGVEEVSAQVDELDAEPPREDEEAPGDDAAEGQA